MADRADRDRWLLDAADKAGDSEDAQIAWLKLRRLEYSEAIRGGDWEVQSVTGEGGSSTSKRHKSDQENHDAIVDALRYLGATDLGSQGSMLHSQFGNIQG